MQHSFEIDVATEYGVNAAILLQNIFFWCEHNRANETNFNDGLYWTYNSGKAFHDLFPYMSEKQVRTALKKLEDENLVITGNYNTVTYDRTKWYAITQKGKSILQKGQMESDKRANGFTQKGEPIPDINTYNKTTDINTDINTKDGGKPPKRERAVKTSYGYYNNVKLTIDEVERLTKDYGEEDTQKAIERLDTYIEEMGCKNKYKNHNLTLRRWVFDAIKRDAQGQKKQAGYDWENL